MRSKEEIDKKYTKDQLLEKLNQINRWTHRIELGSNVVTPGNIPERIMMPEMSAIPKDLTGKTVLDIGTRDGGWAFECERRNAKEVIAIDVWQNEGFISERDLPFRICKEILDSKVEFIEMDVLDIEKIGKKFDLVLFLGVYYHLMDPFLALKKIFDVCNELVILQGAILQSQSSICYFLEPGELRGDPSNTFLFSPTFLSNYAKAIGFSRIEFKGLLGSDDILQSDLLNRRPEHEPFKRNRGIFYLWK